jgi:hypothetical protein
MVRRPLVEALLTTNTIGLRWRPAGLHMLTFLFVIACVGDAAVLPLYLWETALGARMTKPLFAELWNVRVEMTQAWSREGGFAPGEQRCPYAEPAGQCVGA